MNKAVIRSLCVLALVVSIAVRVQANRTREAMMTDFDVGAAVTGVIQEHGYVLRENPVKPPKLLAAAIYFQRPECDQASFVLPYFINAETLPMLARLNKPELDRHFFYMIDRGTSRTGSRCFSNGRSMRCSISSARRDTSL